MKVKIYILIASVYYEDAYSVFGAYRSKEKAEAAKEDAEKTNSFFDYFQIVEIDLE